ncbi:unnamed protein product [Boreogadus saida]
MGLYCLTLGGPGALTLLSLLALPAPPEPCGRGSTGGTAGADPGPTRGRHRARGGAVRGIHHPAEKKRAVPLVTATPGSLRE